MAREQTSDAQYGSVVSWSEFIQRHGNGVKQEAIAKAAHVTSPTVSRWLSGKQGVSATQAASVARALNVPVLEAFVAAGFLTEAEAKVRPRPAPDFTQLTNDELLELVRTRMREEGEGHADGPAATKPPGPGPANPSGQDPGSPLGPPTVLREVSEFEVDWAAREDPPSKDKSSNDPA